MKTKDIGSIKDLYFTSWKQYLHSNLLHFYSYADVVGTIFDFYKDNKNERKIQHSYNYACR